MQSRQCKGMDAVALQNVCTTEGDSRGPSEGPRARWFRPQIPTPDREEHGLMSHLLASLIPESSQLMGILGDIFCLSHDRHEKSLPISGWRTPSKQKIP
jgi:hypothetical protein